MATLSCVSGAFTPVLSGRFASTMATTRAGSTGIEARPIRSEGLVMSWNRGKVSRERELAVSARRDERRGDGWVVRMWC
jgi:hypothetical protein